MVIIGAIRIYHFNVFLMFLQANCKKKLPEKEIHIKLVNLHLYHIISNVDSIDVINIIIV